MKYHVRLTAKAERDIEVVLQWFQEQLAEPAGARWFARLMARVGTLESHPDRCGIAEEAENLGLDVRQLTFGRGRGRHRLLFQIDGRTVNILRIWHSARNAISRDDL